MRTPQPAGSTEVSHRAIEALESTFSPSLKHGCEDGHRVRGGTTEVSDERGLQQSVVFHAHRSPSASDLNASLAPDINKLLRDWK